MDHKQLEYFIKAADANSFSGAAVALRMTQPALSRQIAALETEVGHRLFTRNGRGIALTEAGEILLVHARQILATAQAARDGLRELGSNPGGRVTVGLPPIMAPDVGAHLIEHFRQHMPRVLVTIQEGMSLHLREALIAGHLDLALLFDPPPSPQLLYEELGREEMVLAAPASWKKLPRRMPLAKLAGLPMILPSPPNAIRGPVESALKEAGVELKVVAEVVAVHSLVALVKKGIGCAILPGQSLGLARATGGIQIASLGPPAVCNWMALATPRAKPANRLVREAVAAMRAGLSLPE